MCEYPERKKKCYPGNILVIIFPGRSRRALGIGFPYGQAL